MHLFIQKVVPHFQALVFFTLCGFACCPPPGSLDLDEIDPRAIQSLQRLNDLDTELVETQEDPDGTQTCWTAGLSVQWYCAKNKS